MTRIAYSVTATLPDEATAREYVAWLEDGHVDAVVAAGAHSAMIVRLDRPEPTTLPPGSVQVETRYVFSTSDLFDRYLAHAAPGLRADGLKRFGPERGIRYERRTGVII